MEYEGEGEGEGKRSQIERRLESFSREQKDGGKRRGEKPKRKPALTIYMKTLGSSHNKVRFFMCLRFLTFSH
ncbi:unnamed protein product [Musa acuminata subsp. malaccensis]|uniref:(wild Malaysian banana) hypothetical protein n=1 Tax=Musa acuminata subsp. malaccensis TaxID=214687 RepID=A0A804JKZ4_MUSAM|nr:unnamed protein product [Musa acuminata subsp. malaccensis]